MISQNHLLSSICSSTSGHSESLSRKLLIKASSPPHSSLPTRAEWISLRLASGGLRGGPIEKVQDSLRRRRPALFNQRVFSKLVLALLFSLPLSQGSTRAETSGYEWMPLEAESGSLQSVDAASTALPLRITETPKPTADVSKFQNVYTLELDKFGIRNDGSDAEATSKGINKALQHAKSLKANRIVFPTGTYLIDEKDPVILDHHDTIVDLNGATLQIQTNGLPNYAVVEILPGAKNLRLTNGTIRGDRDDHDYKAAPGTHEGGACVSVVGGENLEIDHLHLTKATGDGLCASSTGARNRDELLKRIFYNVTRKNLESGAFSGNGEKIASNEKIRSVEPYEVGGDKNRFELGYLAGYQGFPWIKGRAYQAYFFDAERRFLEKQNCLQYRKVEVPTGAKYLHVEFNQPGIDEKAAHSGAGDGWLVRINNFTPSTDVHVHHNLMDENRRLGLTGAGQRWLIEENRFERNGGTPPMYGIDLEDGWEMMQDVVIRKNSFKGNQVGDLVICAGSEILVEDNVFEKSVVFHGRTYNYTVRNNEFNGPVQYGTRTGIATISGNTYRNSPRVSIVFDGKGVADGLVRKAGENIPTPPLLLTGEVMEGVKKVSGSYLNFKDSKFENTRFESGEKTHFVRFENSVFEHSDMNFVEKGGDVAFELKGNKGELSTSGPGLGRKMER